MPPKKRNIALLIDLLAHGKKTEAINLSKELCAEKNQRIAHQYNHVRPILQGWHSLYPFPFAQLQPFLNTGRITRKSLYKKAVGLLKSQLVFGLEATPILDSLDLSVVVAGFGNSKSYIVHCEFPPKATTAEEMVRNCRCPCKSFRQAIATRQPTPICAHVVALLLSCSFIRSSEQETNAAFANVISSEGSLAVSQTPSAIRLDILARQLVTPGPHDAFESRENPNQVDRREIDVIENKPFELTKEGRKNFEILKFFSLGLRVVSHENSSEHKKLPLS